jgi:hypothetical protein
MVRLPYSQARPKHGRQIGCGRSHLIDAIDLVERDRRAVALAREYLLTMEGVTQEEIEKHLRPDFNRPGDTSDIYRRMLESAKTPGMKPNVIGDVNRLHDLLCGFEPSAVVEKYGDRSDAVWEDILCQLGPTGQLRQNRRSIWPQYCRTIVSAAAFLAQYQTAEEFHSFVDLFDGDDRARPALPMLLSQVIHGLGFALACDFLKEIGYVRFAKPDVHLKRVFTALGLSQGDDDYSVFRAIGRVAHNAATTPFEVDKLLWLISSGRFYRSDLPVVRHRERFIDYASRQLVP